MEGVTKTGIFSIGKTLLEKHCTVFKTLEDSRFWVKNHVSVRNKSLGTPPCKKIKNQINFEV
jgi:hypothetical protein